MAYQALYRVWRPQKFSDMVGQEIITKTLKNAIITGQTSHAYLFTGPRGTGKTSAAKIFAKALNCLNLIDGEPCNECENCKAINNGSLNDVIEIDAASNNGVEEIRDIRDKAKYAPTQATYKVYIIDEVHMLSTGAFNALLKTLEEPPTQVVFILATTEPHKIPLTIISRTQRFDFRRISLNASIDRMKFILEEKHYQYDDAALKIIANAAEGGMRDALSILDQTLSFGDDEVTLENALLVTGAVRQTLLNAYVTALINKDVKEGLKVLEEILQEGKDAHRLIEDLIAYVRDLLLLGQAPDMVTVNFDDEFSKLSEQVTPDYAYNVINVLNDVQQQLRYTTHPDIYLEVLTVKLANLKVNSDDRFVVQPKPENTIDTTKKDVKEKAIEQIENLINDDDKEVKRSNNQNLNTSKVNNEIKQPQNNVISEVVSINSDKLVDGILFDGVDVFNVLNNATKNDLQNIENVYNDVMNVLSVVETAKMNQATPVAASSTGIVLAFEQPYIHRLVQNDNELQKHLLDAISRMTHVLLNVVLITKDQWIQVRKSYVKQYKDKVKFEDMEIPKLINLKIETKPQLSQVSSDELNIQNVEQTTSLIKDESEFVTQAQELFGNVVTLKKD